MVKLYVDSNVFFYAKIMDRVFGKSCSQILRGIASDNLQASTSVLVPIEVSDALRKYGLAKDVAEEVRAIFSWGLKCTRSIRRTPWRRRRSTKRQG